MKTFLSMIMLLFFISGTLFHTGCKKNDSISARSLTGIKWILESIQYPVQIVPIERTFYILFNEDLTLEMQVDCNSCGGTYELTAGDSISFGEEMVCTDAFCGDDSKDTEFHAALDTASSYDVNGNNLQIYFANGQSRLNFIAESSTFGNQ